MMIDLDKIKLSDGYLLAEKIEYTFFSKIIATSHGYEHYLGKEVIVNHRPADVLVMSASDSSFTYYITHYNRILLQKI